MLENKDSEMRLLPNVKSIVKKEGKLCVQTPVSLKLPEDLKSITPCVLESFADFFSIETCNTMYPMVSFYACNGYGEEGYSIDVDESIRIQYTKPNGAFYALMTLKQMLLNSEMSKCKIMDQPILSIRGYMLDVSRGKIPKITTLMKLIDMLASFKYNHLQLYFEGSPFVYTGYEKYASTDAYTAEEMKQLDKYCRNRFIDLVPNLNTLGHMTSWLSHEEFKHLAEVEEGFCLNGHRFPPTTLNPQDPKSLEFVLTLINGLIPSFQSKCINVGLDEPFELGKGKNVKIAKEKGIAILYADYVNKLHQSLKTKGKTMLMWGDIIGQHNELATTLHQDIIFLDWGYQAEYPFEKKAKMLHDANRKFILCPGTSSWNSVAGITDNMLTNIYNATKAAKQYEGLGTILTDWGEGGHIQHNFVSYPAILYSSALSWGTECDENQLISALNTFVFKDKKHLLGKLVLDLGRYVDFEERALECRTLATILLQFPKARGEQLIAIERGLMELTMSLIPQDLRSIYQTKMSIRSHFDFDKFKQYIKKLQYLLKYSEPQCYDAQILKEEISNTLQLVKTLQAARMELSENHGNEQLALKLIDISKRHKRLFLIRNRYSGLDISLCSIKNLVENLSNVN